MTRTGLELFRRQLLDMAGQKQREFDGIGDEAFRAAAGDAAGNLSHVPTHPGDLGTAVYDQQVSLCLLESSEQRLEEIVGALERIDAGTFGTCGECGEAIGSERLHAVPYAEHCIDCARREERR